MQKWVKRNKSQTWPVLCQDKSIYKISSQYHKRRESKVQKTTFLQRAITQLKLDQTRQKLNKTCITSRQIHIYNFKSMSRKMAWIFATGNESSKRRSKVTKVKLDLYYVKTNSYTKFQVNISKEDWEKFGKPSRWTLRDGRMDGLTDRRQGNL